MLARACFSLVLLACTSAWSQVDTSGTETTTDTDTTAAIPRTTCNCSYRRQSVDRSTRLNSPAKRSQITCVAASPSLSAYSNNISGGGGSNPVSDMSYSIWPTLALDKTTSRLHLVLSYSPGFTFYPARQR